MHQIIQKQPIVLTKQHQKLLKQKKVFVNRRKWFENHLGILCSLINAWETQTLNLKFNRHSEILLQIRNIKFPNLKSLNLSGNSIRSVEGLNQVWLPSLEDLFLGTNHICSIKGIRKLKSPKLQQIQLYDNPIFYANTLTQLSTMPKLVRLSLEWKEHDCFMHDCRPILKLGAQEMEVLVIKSEKRILQKDCCAQLVAKYKNLDLYTKNRE